MLNVNTHCARARAHACMHAYARAHTSLTVPSCHLCLAGLCWHVLRVYLPQQPPLVLLVHLLRADEQQGPSAALTAPPRPPFKAPLPPGEEIHLGSPSLRKIRLASIRDAATRAAAL